jgi:hypothetical protein
MLESSASGRELNGKGFGHDVPLAAEHGVSDCVPRLVDDRFIGHVGE